MATATPGKSKLLYFRNLAQAAAGEGKRLAFQTTHTLSGEGDSDTTATKDGSVSVTTAAAWTLSVENLTSENEVRDIILEALEKTEQIEIWEVDFSRPATTEGKYMGKYMQGGVTSVEYANDADSSSADTAEIAITGTPQKGEITIEPADIEALQYAFRDITAYVPPVEP